MSDEAIVNGLWIGPRLSRLEQLCLRSFIRQGHTFRLWTYGGLETPIPREVVLADANRILPEARVFRYRQGPHRGSLAGFSDIFRAKLLHDVGGWYVDMDVTCLRPLPGHGPYVFRAHHDKLVVGNAMKAPRGSPALARAFALTQERVTADNTDWELPLAILSACIQEHGLADHIEPDLSNRDLMEDVAPRLYTMTRFDAAWSVFHWCNEYLRTLGFPKDRPPFRSRLRTTYREHGVRPRVPAPGVTLAALRHRWAVGSGPARLSALRARWSPRGLFRS